MKVCKIIANLLLLVSLKAVAATQTQYSADFRSYPLSYTATADYSFSDYLWDGRGSVWQYGFYKIGGKLAAHGLAEVYVDLFPVSILQLGASKSLTYRFYKSSTADCSVLVCDGTLDRTTLKAQLALGYADWFVIPGMANIQLSHPESTKQIRVESENLTMSPKSDEQSTKFIVLGKKHGQNTFVVFHRTAEILKTKSQSLANYIVWRRAYPSQWSGQAGIGYYESSDQKKDLSVVFGVSYQLGEGLGLF